MQLTYENLCGVRLDSKLGFVKGKRFLMLYVESCRFCEEPYLTSKQNPSSFCSQSCYQKMRPKEHSEKLYKGRSSRVLGSRNPMYGVRMFGPSNPNYKGGYCKNGFASFDLNSQKLEPIEPTRRHPKDSGLLQVRCTYCNVWFSPRYHNVCSRVDFINGENPYEGRFYCSNGCKLSCPIFNRAVHPKGFRENTSREVQPELRKLVLERDNWICQKCGKTIEEAPLHCHHITGVVQNPIESADMDNCVTLCKECHKYIHRFSGCSYNELRCK